MALVGLLYSPTVASVGLITTYLAFLASGEALARLKRVVRYPCVYWGLAFLGVVMVGVFYATAAWSDRWIDVLKWRTVLWFIVLFALFDDDKWKRRLILTFLLGTGIGLASSFISAWSGIPFWKGPNALLRNNVTQSMSFGIAACVCIWMAMVERLERPLRAVLTVAAILFAANIFFVALGRSGFIVVFSGSVAILLWYLKPRHAVAALAALSIMMGAMPFLSPALQTRLNEGLDQWRHAEESSGETSMGSRKLFYRHTIEIVELHPIIGVGTGGFKKAYGELIANKYNPSDWRSQVTSDPHNQYLAIMVQHGLPGLAVFVAWLVALARTEGGIYRGLALAILSGWCLTSLFSSHFRTFAEGHLVATFLGACLAPEARQRGTVDRAQGDPRS